MTHFLRHFLFILLGAYQAGAMVHTETHSFTVCFQKSQLLIINRQTQSKKILEVCQSPHPMVIYYRKGFIVGKFGKLTIIDLDTLTVTKTANLLDKCCLTQMVVHGKYGYILNTNGNELVIVYLEKEQGKVIEIGPLPISHQLYNGNLYIVHSTSIRTLTIVTNLDPSNIVFHAVGDSTTCSKMIIHGTTGYIPDVIKEIILKVDLTTKKLNGSIDPGCRLFYLPMPVYSGIAFIPDLSTNCINVLDLGSQKTVLVIPVKNTIQDLQIYKDTLYVLDVNGLSLINPKSFLIFGKISVESTPLQQMIFYKDYVALKPNLNSANAKIHIVNLLTQKVEQSVAIVDDWDLDADDMFLFYGVNQIVCSKLFDTPYKGIEPIWFETGEDAYKQFIGAQAVKEYEKARTHFEIALAAGHPKASAWAAYAFLHGKWGTEDDPNSLFWYHEFSQVMDKAYYKDLVFRD